MKLRFHPYTLELRHEIQSRRCLAEGAVRAAEWISGKQGAWDFREIFEQLLRTRDQGTRD